MAQKHQFQNKHISSKNRETVSQLEKFPISFEYNKTIQEVKREMQIRTTN